MFYFIPKINPDGSDAYLKKPGEPIDPNLKKIDDDKDGLFDEDDAEDLNGNGIISVMRIHDESGPLKTYSKDPLLMVQRKIDEMGEWRIIGPEGIDNDKDGKINEDPPGGVRTVSNRNYPAFWAPEWIQSRAGIYPLSEPEAKAQVDFVLAHPNIGTTQSYHTHSGVILWGYCSQGDEHIPLEDIHNFKAIGKLGSEITGYALLSVLREFTSDPSRPRHGDFTDWVYDHFGAFGLCTEIWKAPGETGKSALEGIDENVAMEWNDKELGGKGFINWTKYNHPEIGEIEIGGWNYNFFTQNPPAKFMEEEWKKNCLFELKRAELLPYLQIKEVKTESLGDKLFRIKATVENTGFLPTNVTQKAVQNRRAKPVVAKLELDKADLLCGKDKTEIGHIKGNALPARTMFMLPRGTAPQNKKTVEWLIRVKGKGASARITFVSQKAGTVSRQISFSSQ